MAYTNIVIIDDNPRGAFTAKAGAYAQSGWFLKSTSSDDVVHTGGLPSLAFSDLTVEPTDSQTNIVGIAQDDVTSGNEVAVLTNGVFIVPVGSSTATAGASATAEAYGSGTNDLGGMAGDAVLGTDTVVGTFLTGGTQDGYALLKLNL